MSNLPNCDYIRWDSKGVEEVPPNESEDIQAVVEKVNETQRRFYEKNGYCFTGTHARTQGIVRGTMHVSDNLPPHLKQTELFAQAGEYPVICRYSSEPSDPKLDFNSTPALDLADAETTKEIFDLRLKYGYNTKEQGEKIEQRSDKELQQARNQVPNQHLESITFYSQTAYRFGDYVIKYSLVPYSQVQKKRSEETVDKQPDGVLHEWLQDFYRNNEAEYLFQVQLLENLKDQPVDYGGTEWDSERYPWQTVAKLVFPKQNSWNEERNRFWADHLRVDPWHGLISLQPLGSSNRLRRILYPASSAFRRHLNGKKEINVKSIEEIPGY